MGVWIILRKNLQNAAYPEIVFCYIAQKFGYFILPHIVLYFIFCHGFLLELCRSVLTKMPIFFTYIFFPVTYFVSYFVLTHKLIIIFKFWHEKKMTFILPYLPKVCFVLMH
jgi:hypothetical protein